MTGVDDSPEMLPDHPGGLQNRLRTAVRCPSPAIGAIRPAPRFCCDGSRGFEAASFSSQARAVRRVPARSLANASFSARVFRRGALQPLPPGTQEGPVCPPSTVPGAPPAAPCRPGASAPPARPRSFLRVPRSPEGQPATLLPVQQQYRWLPRPTRSLCVESSGGSPRPVGGTSASVGPGRSLAPCQHPPPRSMITSPILPSTTTG